jgi:hypothetical protein
MKTKIEFIVTKLNSLLNSELIAFDKYRIVECGTKPEAEAIEHLAIYLLNPPLTK